MIRGETERREGDGKSARRERGGCKEPSVVWAATYGRRVSGEYDAGPRGYGVIKRLLRAWLDAPVWYDVNETSTVMGRVSAVAADGRERLRKGMVGPFALYWCTMAMW